MEIDVVNSSLLSDRASIHHQRVPSLGNYELTCNPLQLIAAGL